MTRRQPRARARTFQATRDRPSRREEILSVAAVLFAARGFSGVTVDDIGAATGVSGPAIYHHFQSKEALLGEMLVSISEYLLEDATALVADGGSPDDLLEALIEHHVEFSVGEQELITVHFRDLVHASDADRRKVRRLQARYVDVWVDVMLLKAPGTDAHRARAAVYATLGLLNSTPYSSRLAQTQMIDLLRTMARGALLSAVQAPVTPIVAVTVTSADR
jgi:AcrR family transcriptional regulator